MTQDEFEAGYAARSGMTLEEYREHYIGLPCECGDETCEGWASVMRTPEDIVRHLTWSAPDFLKRYNTRSTPPTPHDPVKKEAKGWR